MFSPSSLLHRLLVTILMFSAAGCALHSPTATELATENKFIRHVYTAPTFDIVAYTRFAPSDDLTVYIEGDGRAWLTRTRPSSDPTPVPPLALALAVKDPTPNVVYLARPCQYTAGTSGFRTCTTRDWTSARMSPDVINDMNNALTQIKTESGARRLHLVGYSGGGGVAILLAAQRKDVASIRTVAGNLNISLWTRLHNISPLSGSLPPENYTHAVRNIPQTHYVGAEDSNIPVEIAKSFIKRSSGAHIAVNVISGCSHSKGWEEKWPYLLHAYHQNVP
ncbi:alpha/beta fold hydrolase [Halodesulfovibrio aestuarii]|uniref:Alpha/beta hydrolase n=1 Tax=Halodesulfovibrio aestuarii TaxID=126333 RepID=A0A8G2CC11_9BACT|nr:alpha/beta hydrolase [Halodesulfovibrio aestuarii]SHJ68418.1 hypothetical protein SAMN05660830_03011 [Halodesulfovibrio aestuarii]